MTTAISTALTAIMRSYLAPSRTLDSTSLPYWSVPNQCSMPGGWNLLAILSSIGSYGVMKGAKTARNTMPPVINRPATSEELSFRFLDLRISDPGINDADSHIDKQVHDAEHHRHEQRDSGNGVVIEVVDGIQIVEADAGPGKDTLHQNVPTEQTGQLQADNSDCGYQGIPQGVPVVDPARACAFGVGRANVVIPE